MTTIGNAERPDRKWLYLRVGADLLVLVILFGAMVSARAMAVASGVALLALVLYAWFGLRGPARHRIILLGIAAAIVGAVVAAVVAWG